MSAESQSEEFGGYRIVRRLGAGGMSVVYEVVNPRTGSRQALKVFDYRGREPEVRARFEDEGRLLARLDHPRIVKVLDIGVTADNRPYFVMSLVLDAEGQQRSLADVVPGTIDEETVGRWHDDIREGLRYIHAQGIVHRDLKLENLLIGTDGHVVLTDFGISHIGAAADEDQEDAVKTLVKVCDGQRLVMGSVGYMAPEVEMGVDASPQSDWYALGVIDFRLLTGTWCDARTEVVGLLDGYDVVWSRILPKLLHANPRGRECLGYAEERRASQERIELEAAARQDELTQDLRKKDIRLRKVFIVTIGMVALAAMFAWLWCRADAQGAKERQLRQDDDRRLAEASSALCELVRKPPTDKFNQFGINGKMLLIRVQEIALGMRQ